MIIDSKASFKAIFSPTLFFFLIRAWLELCFGFVLKLINCGIVLFGETQHK